MIIITIKIFYLKLPDNSSQTNCQFTPEGGKGSLFSFISEIPLDKMLNGFLYKLAKEYKT